jgi:hypothetical protein
MIRSLSLPETHTVEMGTKKKKKPSGRVQGSIAPDLRRQRRGLYRLHTGGVSPRCKSESSASAMRGRLGTIP